VHGDEAAGSGLGGCNWATRSMALRGAPEPHDTFQFTTGLMGKAGVGRRSDDRQVMLIAGVLAFNGRMVLEREDHTACAHDRRTHS
jgi:hypothetical protein